jgi:hypothetical protein
MEKRKYRGYTVVIGTHQALVYEGTFLIHTVYGNDEKSNVEQAKDWINDRMGELMKQRVYSV